jgi:hypothetical protein
MILNSYLIRMEAGLMNKAGTLMQMQSGQILHSNNQNLKVKMINKTKIKIKRQNKLVKNKVNKEKIN